MSNKLVSGVLRSFFAADDPDVKGVEDPTAPNKPLPDKEITPSTSEVLKIVNRIYFYTVDPSKKIDFNNLTTILSGTSQESKNQLIMNLKGGNTGDAHADYFKWTSLFVKAISPSDQKRIVVYQFDLNPWGTIATKNQMFKSEVADFNPPTPVEVSQDTENYNLFSNVNQLTKMIVLSSGPEAIYTDKELSANFGKILLTGQAESLIPNPQNFNAFKNEVFAYYRIWIPVQGIEELRNVDGSKPITDQLPQAMGSKQYKGGSDFYKKFMAAGRFKDPTAEGTQEAMPNITKAPEQQPAQAQPESGARFEPVTTKSANLIKLKEDKDRVVSTYTGSFDIMQQLVKAQQNKMKIRKEAMYQQPTTGTPSSEVTTRVPIGNPQQTQKVTNKLNELSKQMANITKGKINPGSTQPTPQGTQSVYASINSSKIASVMNKYFKSL
jgi:hypothetical protein